MKRGPWMGARARLGVVLAVILGGGCVKQKIVFRVKPDGSGHIIVARVFGRQAVAQYTASLASMRATADEEDSPASNVSTGDPFFSEKLARSVAGYFGPGVKLAKARPYGRDGSRGFVAVYTFEDINKVYLNFKDAWPDIKSLTAAVESDDDDAAPVAVVVPKTENAFSFSMTNGPSATLVVHLPKFPDPARETDDDAATGEVDESDAGPFQSLERSARMAMLRRAAMRSSWSSDFMSISMPGYYGQSMPESDASLAVSVEVEGQVIETTAAHPSAEATNRWTLLCLDAASLTADEKNGKRLEAMSSDSLGGPGELIEGLMALPGAVCERQRTVRITFE